MQTRESPQGIRETLITNSQYWFCISTRKNIGTKSPVPKAKWAQVSERCNSLDNIYQALFISSLDSSLNQVPHVQVIVGASQMY